MKLGYNYMQSKGGYIRHKIISDEDSFIARILANKCNRGLWRRIYGETICRWFGHAPSLELEKGKVNKYGDYKIMLCSKCRGLVRFYGGIE